MSKLNLEQETHQILGCAMEVLNSVGHGFHEKIYENGLMVEFKLQSVPVSQQQNSRSFTNRLSWEHISPTWSVLNRSSSIRKRLTESPIMKSGKCWTTWRLQDYKLVCWSILSMRSLNGSELCWTVSDKRASDERRWKLCPDIRVHPWLNKTISNLSCTFSFAKS